MQFAEAEGMGRLVESIEGNTKRYQQLFAEVIDDIIPRSTEASEPDVADILAHHVSQTLSMQTQQQTATCHAIPAQPRCLSWSKGVYVAH